MTEPQTKTLTNKDEIIKQVSIQLKEDGLTDLTGWINDHCPETHMHSGFVRSIAYRMEKLGIVEVIPVQDWQRFYVKELSWHQRHPYLHAIRINATNSIFSLLVGILLGILINKSKGSNSDEFNHTEKIQLHNLTDSINIVRQNVASLRDSLTSLSSRFLMDSTK